MSVAKVFVYEVLYGCLRCVEGEGGGGEVPRVGWKKMTTKIRSPRKLWKLPMSQHVRLDRRSHITHKLGQSPEAEHERQWVGSLQRVDKN